jgi:hypothetical protein
MNITNLYCHDCLTRVALEMEKSDVRFCPYCASNNISTHVPELDYEEQLDKLVEQVVADPDYDYNETTEIIDELGQYLKHIAFRRQHGAHLDMLMLDMLMNQAFGLQRR